MPMEKERITGVPETMLQTLYARAAETQTGRGYINDEKAVDIVSRLNYDFSRADQDMAMRNGVVARTILLDDMTKEFLTAHPDTTVINIACGLDTRCHRMTGLYRTWYDLDLPAVMNIRRRFFVETEAIRQLPCSAMDERWTSQLEYTSGPVLVIVEGLSMYLSEPDVKQLFSILDRKFTSVSVFFEVMNPWAVSHVKEKSIEGSKAKFTWGIKTGIDLEKLIPPFRSIQDRSLTEGMKVFMPVYKILGKISLIRNISNKILVLQK